MNKTNPQETITKCKNSVFIKMLIVALFGIQEHLEDIAGLVPGYSNKASLARK